MRLNKNSLFQRVEIIEGKGESTGNQCFDRASSSRLLTFSQTKLCFYMCAVKTLWEKKKLLLMNNFSFSHSVFYPLRELSAIFIKFENSLSLEESMTVDWERVKTSDCVIKGKTNAKRNFLFHILIFREQQIYPYLQLLLNQSPPAPEG